MENLQLYYGNKDDFFDYWEDNKEHTNALFVHLIKYGFEVEKQKNSITAKAHWNCQDIER